MTDLCLEKNKTSIAHKSSGALSAEMQQTEIVKYDIVKNNANRDMQESS